MQRLLSVLLLVCMSTGISLAQSPEMFNYQAVLRDASGNIMTNQTVDVRLGIYDGSTMEYEETHNVTTDQYGLISLEAGNGTATSGTFSNLDWANTQYEIKVEVDDGSGYVSLGQQPLSSVPYALHAESAPSMQLDELNDVNAGSPSSNEVLKWNGSAWTPQADNSGGGSVWNTSGSDIDYSAGAVGIGTSSPSEMLEVDGSVQFGDSIHFGSAELIFDGGANEIWTNSDLVPEGSDDLGTSSESWNDLYVEDVNVEDIDPATTNPVNLNGSLNITENLYMTSSFSGNDTLFLGSFEFITDGADEFIFGSGTIAANLLPSTDNAGDLGSSANRWQDVYASNGTIQTSDRRDKTSINDLDYGLEEVMNLRAVRFKWKEKENRGYKLGVIAQEVQGVLPEVVKTHDYKSTEEGGPVKKVKNERLGVYYSDMIPVLINAIQEQQKQIEDLKAQNQELKQLKSEVDALKQQIKNLK